MNATPVPTGYNPAARGCTTCGSQDTATADGIHGRRCATHPPTFDPARAVELAVRDGLGTALAYLRAVA